MKLIYALYDYKQVFNSKKYSPIYREGMDKNKLIKYFLDYEYKLIFEPMHKALSLEVGDIPVIYTSQEDPGYLYKNFIEDIILALENKGAITLPPFLYLRANNNKVFMEFLRNHILPPKYHSHTMVFGCFEELMSDIDKIEFPCVIKTSEGATSRGVYKASNKEDLIRISKKISRSPNIKYEIRDKARALKHKGYKKKSLHRKKFIVQDYIDNISNDWKVLVYYDKIFVLRRQNRPGDFRASGSGLFSFDNVVDERLLNNAIEIRQILNLPMVSLDLAIKDNKIILFEFQAVYFGTTTLEKSPYYYLYENGVWTQHIGESRLEETYAYSIVKYLEEVKRL